MLLIIKTIIVLIEIVPIVHPLLTALYAKRDHYHKNQHTKDDSKKLCGKRLVSTTSAVDSSRRTSLPAAPFRDRGIAPMLTK